MHIEWVAAFVAVAGAATTAIVAAANLKPNRRKLSAEADKAQGEVPFVGGSYVKDISDAASSLVTPLRSENETLRRRVLDLEIKILALESERSEIIRKLEYERDVNSTLANRYDRRMKRIVQAHNEEISRLQMEIKILSKGISDES